MLKYAVCFSHRFFWCNFGAVLLCLIGGSSVNGQSSSVSNNAASQVRQDGKTWICPMKCRGLVFDTPGRCPACFMDLVAAKNGSAKKKNEASRQAKSIYGIEVEEEGPMMPGMSLTVFAIGVVSVSVIVIATLLQRTISTWERTSNQRHRRKYPRFDLLSVKPLKRLVQWKGFPFAIQSPVVFLFVLVIVADLIREVDNGKNITLILTWNIWWMGLVFFSFLGGTIWCSVCPWMAIPDWLFRLAAKLIAARKRN